MEKEEFVKFMESVYCGAMVNACLTFGHELGIFDVLFNAEEPVSLQFIAETKNLKERYTKELLSALVSARILYQDRDTNCYNIPESFKQELKQMIGIVPGLKAYFERADRTFDCFRKDGPYESGITVLDVGCGGACFTTALAKMFPKSNFTGLDISAKGLQLARETVEKNSLENVQLIEGDCHRLTHYISSQYDLIFMYDTLHDFHNPHKALEEIYKSLNDDGSFTLFDVGFHSNPVDNVGNMRAAFFYGNSLLHCLPSSMLGEPHIGYGACWGMEEIEAAVSGAKFKITRRSLDKDSFVPMAAFNCTK